MTGVLLTDYLQDLPPSGKTAGTNFSQEAENHHFHPAAATCCTDSSEIWSGQEAPGLLGRAKFHFNRLTGVGTRPQNINNFRFLVKMSVAGANP